MMCVAFLKKTILLKTIFGGSIVVFLVGCGGNGGGDSSTITANNAPTSIKLVSVIAVDSSLALKWEAAQDDKTPANKMTYQVHLSEFPSFTPNMTTLEQIVVNQTAITVTGLKIATTYYVKIVAIDEAGLSASSQVLSASTSANLSENISLLNDTGITWCANDNTNFSDCSATSLGGWFGLNQDGEVGRDITVINKVGGGDAGFDFTKISASGEILSANATLWSCVRDNHTGLVWEVKTDDRGLRDSYQTYQWYNSDMLNNGGLAGYQNNGNNTQAFTQKVNSQGLCGFNNWRLPTKQELHSIVNYGKYDLKIDSTYFPNTQAGFYWTSSASAANSNYASIVNFGNNEGSNVSGTVKSDKVYIRLVRTRQ